MAKEFTWREKLDYYRRRSLDKTLTSGQRDYVNRFLDGFDEVDSYNKKNGFESVSNHEMHARQSKSLIALNKQYGGDIAYFGGSAAAHEKAVDKLKERKK